MGARNKPLLLSLKPRLWRHGSTVPLPIHLSMDHDSRSPVSPVSFRLVNHTMASNRRLRSTDPRPSSSHPGPCVSHQSPANWLPGPRGRAAQGPKLPPLPSIHGSNGSRQASHCATSMHRWTILKLHRLLGSSSKGFPSPAHAHQLSHTSGRLTGPGRFKPEPWSVFTPSQLRLPSTTGATQAS